MGNSAIPADSTYSLEGIQVPQSPQQIFDGSKFKIWREQQAETIQKVLQSDKRFFVMNQPTGSGKSLTYMAMAALSGVNTMTLTSTKALQTQLIEDFLILHDIRGMSSYACPLDGKTPVEKAPCRAGVACDQMKAADEDSPYAIPCQYYRDLAATKRERNVITNYSLWMTSQKFEIPLGHRHILILDEAHDAFQHLLSFLSIELTDFLFRKHAGESLPRLGHKSESWAAWAKSLLPEMKGKLETLRTTLKVRGGSLLDPQMWQNVAELKNVVSSLADVSELSGEWRSHVDADKGIIQLDPLYPADYTIEKILFQGVDKVILASATITEKSVRLLGIKNFEMVKTQSSFCKTRRPVYPIHAPRLKYGSPQGDLKRWVKAIDDIIEDRQDRKGIIHTVSYDRAEFIRDNSRFSNLMYLPKSSAVQEVVEAFKNMDEPGILVSPAVTTGYDFPGDSCRYQIIAKIPFPSLASQVMKDRCEVDKDLMGYMSAQTIVQMSGRGVRTPDDWCETFIVDGNWGAWFWKSNSRFTPDWFKESVQAVSSQIPEPLDY